MIPVSRFESWTAVPRRVRKTRLGIAALYLRSRRAGWAATMLALIVFVAWVGTRWMLSLPESGVETGALVPFVVMGALAAACVIGAGAGSPFCEVERTGARPLPPLRLAHLGGLLLLTALVLAAVLLAFDLDGARPKEPLIMLLRNLAGFAGLALLAARVSGAGLSWLVPLAFAGAAYFAGRLPDGSYASWAWHMQPGDDGLSRIVSLALFVAGLAVAVLFGARETPGEVE